MKLYNLKDHNEQVSFAQAVTQGLGKNQGLFFPHDLPEFSLTEIDEMLKLDFVTRSAKILSAFIGDEIPQEILEERVRAAFVFPAPVANVESDVGCLELFHWLIARNMGQHLCHKATAEIFKCQRQWLMLSTVYRM